MQTISPRERRTSPASKRIELVTVPYLLDYQRETQIYGTVAHTERSHRDWTTAPSH